MSQRRSLVICFIFNLLLIIHTDAGRYGSSSRAGSSSNRVASTGSRSSHWPSSSSASSSSISRPFSVSGTNGNSNNRGRFSSLMKTLSGAPARDVPSSRLGSGDVLSDPFGGKSTMSRLGNNFGLSSTRPLAMDTGPSTQMKGKSSKAKLAAAGLLGVPLMASVAAGAFASRHKSPYEYGRIVSSYEDSEDPFYVNNYFTSDLSDISSTGDSDVPTVASGQASSVDTSIQSSTSADNQHSIRQESTSGEKQERRAPEESTTSATKSPLEEKTRVGASEPTAKSTVAIESGELHDLFGSARRGQKEVLQGDSSHSQSNLLQLSNREYAAFNYPSEYDTLSPGKSTFGDIYFVAIVAGVGIASIFGVIGTGYCLYRINQHAKATADIEYPAYGVVGPITKDPPSTHSAYSSGNVSPTGDRKLAQTAQMYHYQHQKAAMMASASASRSSSAVPGKRLTSTSEGDSEEEADEIGYIVYECPGLAPTGEMEVKNPLFHDDSAPASPAKGSNSFLPKTPEGKSKSVPDSAGKRSVDDHGDDLK